MGNGDPPVQESATIPFEKIAGGARFVFSDDSRYIVRSVQCGGEGFGHAGDCEDVHLSLQRDGRKGGKDYDTGGARLQHAV